MDHASRCLHTSTRSTNTIKAIILQENHAENKTKLKLAPRNNLSEYICRILLGCIFLNQNLTFFKMVPRINMLSTCMMNLVLGQINGTHIVTVNNQLNLQDTQIIKLTFHPYRFLHSLSTSHMLCPVEDKATIVCKIYLQLMGPPVSANT